mmetsp:Transcript_5076/g.10067  ORF Transcript_5076/g.10067 Transcript_5076/m.10067 type:complete len:264 (+) Transcript_5076:247-1038(+)
MPPAHDWVDRIASFPNSHAWSHASTARINSLLFFLLKIVWLRVGVVAPSFDNFDPVSIRIKGKSQSFHSSSIGSLLHGISCVLELLALLKHIIHKESNVSKSFGPLFVARVVLEGRVSLRAMVMSQFQDGLVRIAIIAARRAARQEIKRKVAEMLLGDLRHPHVFAVEFEALDRILYTKHRLLESEVSKGVCHGNGSLHYLHPVHVRIVRKRKAFHSSFVRLLLERYPFLFESLGRLVHIVTGKCNMPKPVIFFVSWMVTKRR